MTNAIGRPASEVEPGAGRAWPRAAAGYALLALAAFVPVLRSDPGKVAADTKQYLYLDPSRLLARAASMWDPHIGMGTVTHQNIGYLFPMGPYYWLFNAARVPDWVAQRLWLGSILFFAGVGVLYLLRTFGLRGPGIAIAAVAYMFTPYTLDYSARISALLLPFAALPWMIGLVRKALRHGGWRYPAIFALVVQLVGGVNATALIFAGVGPVLWILYAWLVDQEFDWRRAISVTARIAVLTLVTSLWWIAGLEMQGTYGLDILKYTETVKAVAIASYPNEILRGLGYWFFYGQDRIGPWIESANQYTQRPVILLAGYGLAVACLLAAGVMRWRHRLFFVGLLLVGMIIAVGPSPYSHPTPIGSVFKTFATSSTAGFALRSTGRAVPLVVLALSVLLGLGLNAAVKSLRGRGHARLGWALIAGVMVLIVVNLPALFDGSFYGKNLERPENVPAYWTQAAKYLDSKGDATRVLEAPGSDFAAYTWGNTVDPITPGIMDRPYVARELIPYGTAGTADLLNALDLRFQEGVADPRGLAAVLRRMGVGDVVLRNDLQYQRYNLVSPRDLSRVFKAIPGLGAPTGFGAPTPSSQIKPNVPGARVEDEIDLSAPANEPLLRPVDVYPVENPVPIVRAEPAAHSLMIAGDGDGLIDAANVGLLDAAGPTQYSASFPTAPALRRATAPDATLVVTDGNRFRARNWGSVRDNVGYTEQAGEKPLASDPQDQRLPEFPGERDDARTTTQQRGVKTVQASAYGNTISYTPEDRAARALDGDPTTAWRALAFGNPIGQYIRLQLDGPITTDHINLVQPINGGRNRWITKVDLVFDGHTKVSAVLDASSRSAAGQTLSFGPRRFTTLEIRITGVSDDRHRLFGGADGVGFAEIRLRDLHADHDVRVDEVVQMPRDLLSSLGPNAATHSLIVLMSRDALRPVPPRTDPELSIARTFDLPGARTFAFTGSASVNPGASNAAIDTALGATGSVTADDRESMPGCLQCRAASAADGNPATAWNTPFVGVAGQWVQFDSRRPLTFSHMDLQVVADGRHSVPTSIELDVDGAIRDLTLPAIADQPAENATKTVRLQFAKITGRRIRVTVNGVRPVLATRESTGDTVAAPSAIAELGIPGLRAPAAPATLPAACRSDLMSIDGRPFPVRVSGSTSAAANIAGLSVTPCDPRDPSRVPVISLGPGQHVVRTSEGVRTGLQLDRIVLASAAGGGPLAVAGGRVTGLGSSPAPAPKVTVTQNGATKLQVHVSGATTPFWLVLGESQSPGWKATVAHAGSSGTSQLVDGYANGWLVRPSRSSFDVSLEWTPQRRVWLAIWISVLAVLMCLGIACWSFVRRRVKAQDAVPQPADAEVSVEWPARPRGSGRARPRRDRVVVPLLAGIGAALVVAPWVGAVVLLAVVAVQWHPSLRAGLALAPPVLVGMVMIYIVYLQHHFRFPPVFEWPTLFPLGRPLAWLAVVLLAVDVFVERSRSWSPRGDSSAGGQR